MIDNDHLLDITTAKKFNSRHWALGQITWGELVAWADEPADQKDCGNYVLGRFVETTLDHTGSSPVKDCTGLHRRKSAVEDRCAITLDADYAQEDLPELVELLTSGAALIHTTYSSAPDKLRLRLIFPLDRRVNAEEYGMIAHVLMKRFGIHQFDLGSVQAERYMFKPAAQQAAWYQHWVIDGDLSPADELIDLYEPTALGEGPTPSRNKRDPYTLDGVLGAFNRAYSIEEAIDAFELPYVPEGADRWTLAGSVSPAGMGIVAPGLAFSHHTTDPAWGVTCSAFDLVRLHLFGELDSDQSPATPVNRRASHMAMLDFASRDALVVAEIVGADFDPLAADDSPTSWKLGLTISPRDGKMRDEIGNWDLIVANDPVFTGLYYNEMTLTVETSSGLPWRPLERGGPAITGVDRAAVAHYLEREYKVRPARTLVDELINVRAQQTYVNPVRDYLGGLVWDGVPRVETCLPGVRDTPFTRLVARKVMVAAVARIYDPGCKWDHTLILFGPEGLGKSWWINRMSRGFSSSLGRIGDKDTLLIMRRTWIMVSDEGHSLKKADADSQKEFLTRTEDVFRMPYDREALAHPRQCVIWGTTNDEVFLRRQEGNRRFLIVRCEDKVDFDRLTEDYVAQVWAEAVQMYLAGEPLFLDEESSALAAEEREAFTEEDALGGIVQEYLERWVPEEWDEMSPEARVMWIQNRKDGLVPVGTRQITQACSAQLWVEAYGRRIGDHRRVDLLEIMAAMRQVPGWRPGGKQRVPFYGPQTVVERTPIDDGMDLI